MKKKPIQVLLLEDNPGDARLFREFLREGDLAQVELDHVERLKTGLEHLTQGKPDVILLDLGLPDSQGLDTFTQVYARAPDVPIVVLTGLNDAEQAVEAVRAGAQDYLVKGEVSSGLLVRAIRYAIERKQAEAALWVAESQLRAVLNNAPLTIFATDSHGVFTLSEGKGLEGTGLKPGENVGLSAIDLYRSLPFVEYGGQVTAGEDVIRRVLAGEEVTATTELRGVYFDNHIGPLRGTDGKVAGIVGIAVDITERMRAESELLKLREAVETSGEVIFMTDRDGLITFVNPEFTRLYGYTAEEVIGKTTPRILKSDSVKPEEYALLWQSILKKQVVKGELVDKTKDGRLLTIESSINPILDDGGNIAGFLAIQRDISERKRAGEALRQSERSLTEAQRLGQLGSWDWDAKTDVITWSEEYCHVYGFDPTWPSPGYEEHLKAYTSESAARLDAAVKQSIQTGETYELDLEQARPDGMRRWVTARGECKRDAQGQIVGLRGTAQDITERKQREVELQAIAAVSAALRTAPSRAEMLPIILDQLLALLYADGAALAMRDPAGGDTVVEGARGEFAQGLRARLAPGEGVSGVVIASGKPFVTSDIRKETGLTLRRTFKTVRAVACVPLVVQDQIIGAVWVGRQSAISADEVRLLTAIADIAANAIHRETLHEQTVRQVARLQALRAIDQAISGSFDLRMTLNVVLEQAAAQLQVDAAAVLLLNPYTQTLEYAAGRGFRTRDIERTRVRLGEGQAGRAALDRMTISDFGLQNADFGNDLPQSAIHTQSAQLEAEGFVVHIAAPLVAKGQVRGVLEVFQRAPLNPDPDWLSFFETLAGQAAIAIDNLQLFDNLQRSNVELSLAYDATIEGWSHALDLRDKETEGHTLRVTGITLRLAQAMGVGDAELVHLRRGALLHDIGKMGVPDGILRKPGPLTDDEWAIMRQHPQHAHDMLSPISYLRLALDIPYCHHERWDGSGYPRGLKGEQIPLAARLFAVVDVWDALRSDRPYRAAWPEEKVIEHIKAGSGSHFDPKVVEAFLKVMEK